MPQLEVTHAPAPGYPGLLADISPRTVRSAVCQSTGPLPFGVAVKAGTADDTFAALSGEGDLVAGILVRSHSFVSHDGGPVKKGDVAGLLTLGAIWVLVEAPVTPADMVHVRHTASGENTQVGAFRGNADGDTASAVLGARFLGSAGAGGLVQVEFSALMNRSLTLAAGGLGNDIDALDTRVTALENA